MSADNRDEMQPEYDMRGAARGKYLERYRRWTSITDATGTVEILAVSSSSGVAPVEIVLPQVQIIFAPGPVLGETRPVIAPEESAPPVDAL
jgi:hypothetical protein